jgi:uncharacterized protein YkwD
MRRFWFLATILGCATPSRPPPAAVEAASHGAPEPKSDDRSRSELGPPSDQYWTTPRPGGVAGGRSADELAKLVVDGLRARGGEAAPDGALARTAGWYLSETAIGRDPDAAEADRVARHLGFAGPVLAAAAFSLPSRGDEWQRALAQVPANMSVNRFGIRVSRSGESGAVVFGVVEATLEPFARRLAVGQSLQLRGEITSRFSFGHVYLTSPDGKVKETRLSGRQIDVTLPMAVPGVYKVEVMGDGAPGPVVVVNVPVYVGIAESTAAAPTTAAAPAPAALTEGRLLSLLNGARATAGLAPLTPDPELRSLALAHTEDMAKNGFFGHISPTTGSPEDRARRAGLVVATLGENVAQAATPELAHESLMDSPGHRANMLRPDFTHVGIASVPLPSQTLIATLVFGRRASAASLEASAANVLETIAALRKAKGVRPVARDRALQAAADTAIRALAAGGAPERALAAANAALAAQDAKSERHPQQGRRGGCVQLFELLDLAQLERYPILADSRARKLGVAVTPLRRGSAAVLAVLVLIDGVPCE